MNPAFPLALLAAIHASVALAAPPSDAEVFSRIRSIQMEYAALEQEDVRKAKQQFRGMIAEMARGFDLAGMTPYQSVVIGPLLDSGALDAGQKRALTEALERAADNDVYGAPALLLLHSLNYWDDPEHTCLVRVFEHPRMAATMAGPPVVRLAIEPGHRRASNGCALALARLQAVLPLEVAMAEPRATALRRQTRSHARPIVAEIRRSEIPGPVHLLR